MSLFYPTRAKVERLPEQHRDLVLRMTLGAMQDRAAWHALLGSLMTHNDVTGGRSKYALPPRFLDVALPLLQILLSDAAPDAQIGLAFSGRLPLPGPDRLLGDAPATPGRRARVGVRENFGYDVPLQAETTLRDGSRILIRERRRRRTRHWSQRSSSGKTKRKSKSKDLYYYEVVLMLPRGVQPVHPQMRPPGAWSVTLRDGERVRVKVAGKSPYQYALPQLLDMITEAFRWSPRTRMTEAPA